MSNKKNHLIILLQLFLFQIKLYLPYQIVNAIPSIYKGSMPYVTSHFWFDIFCFSDAYSHCSNLINQHQYLQIFYVWKTNQDHMTVCLSTLQLLDAYQKNIWRTMGLKRWTNHELTLIFSVLKQYEMNFKTKIYSWKYSILYTFPRLCTYQKHVPMQMDLRLQIALTALTLYNGLEHIWISQSP